MLSLRSLPLVRALATVRPAASSVSATNSLAPLPISAVFRLWNCAYDHSTYPIAPSVWATNADTPSLPAAALPAWIGQVRLLPKPHADAAVLARNAVKLSVVPELSERWAALIGVAGSTVRGLSATIAGSFQAVPPPRQS